MKKHLLIIILFLQQMQNIISIPPKQELLFMFDETKQDEKNDAMKAPRLDIDSLLAGLLAGNFETNQVPLDIIYKCLLILRCNHKTFCDKINTINDELQDVFESLSVNFELTCSKIAIFNELLEEHDIDVDQSFSTLCEKIQNIDALLDEHIITVSTNNKIICNKLLQLIEQIQDNTEDIEQDFTDIGTKIIAINENGNTFINTVTINENIIDEKLDNLNQKINQHNEDVVESFSIVCEKINNINQTIATATTNDTDATIITCSQLNILKENLIEHSDTVSIDFNILCNKLLETNSSFTQLLDTFTKLNTQVCEKLSNLNDELINHNENTQSNFQIVCDKITLIDQNTAQGFEEIDLELDELVMSICMKIGQLEAGTNGSCDFLITQTHIDAGFVTPFANTVYCLGESVTYTTDCAILINKNNVVLNLQDRTITGTQGTGIKIQDTSGAIIKNGSLDGQTNSTGISIENSSFIKLSNICSLGSRNAITINSSGQFLLDKIRTYQGSITLQACKNSIIKNCDISDITGSNNGIGFEVFNCSNALFEKNTVEDVTITGQTAYGISIESSNNIKLQDCIVQDISSDSTFSSAFRNISNTSINMKKCLAKNITGDNSRVVFFTQDSNNMLLKDCHSSQMNDSQDYSLLSSGQIIIKKCSAFSPQTDQSNNTKYAIFTNNCNTLEINDSTLIATTGGFTRGIINNQSENSTITKNRILLYAGILPASPSTILDKNTIICGQNSIFNNALTPYPNPADNLQVTNNCILGTKDVINPILPQWGFGIGVIGNNHQIYNNAVVAGIYGGIVALGANESFAHNVSVHNGFNYGVVPFVVASAAAEFWDNVANV